jgi:hypothetical protein
VEEPFNVDFDIESLLVGLRYACPTLQIDVHRRTSDFEGEKNRLGKYSGRKRPFSPGNRALLEDRLFRPLEFPRKTIGEPEARIRENREKAGKTSFFAASPDRPI